MQQWDGLISDPNSLVILMGATNIANSIDRAILRRMPASFHINLPTQHQRKEILRKILREEHYADDLDFDHISSVTKGKSLKVTGLLKTIFILLQVFLALI